MKEYKTVTVPEHTKRELTLVRCDMCDSTVSDKAKHYVVDKYTSMGVGGSSGCGPQVRIPIYLCEKCLNRLAETNA